MLKHGVNVTASRQNVMIKGCASEKEWEWTLNLMAIAKNKKQKLTMTTFNYVLVGCGKDKQWRKVIDVYEDIPSDLQVRLNNEALGSVLKAFAASGAYICSGSMEQASKVLLERSVELELGDYEFVLNALSRDAHWCDVIEMYESIPESLQSQLNGEAVASIIKAHTQSDLAAQGLEIFDAHESKWNSSACTAAMEALLENRQYDDLLALADEMRRHGIQWTPSIYKMVALANIRNGSIRKAGRLLKNLANEMTNASIECYRELIQHYETRHNAVEANRLSVEMMQNNAHVGLEDWQRALELSINLPDLTSYQILRRLLRLNGEAIAKGIPEYLLLPEEDMH